MENERKNSENRPDPNRSALDTYYANRNAKRAAFRVNIEGLDNEPPAYVPKNGAQRPNPQQSVVRQTRPQSSARDGVLRAPTASQQAQRSAPARPSRQAPQPQPQRTKKRKKKEKHSGYNFARGLMITLMCLIFIGILTATVSTLAISTLNDILAVNKDGGSTVSIVVPENSDFDDVFNILCENDLVHQKTLVKLFCKFRHYDIKRGKPVTYEPGVYYIETDSGIEAMLEMIKATTNTSRETVRLTFPEGWTIAKVFERIEKYNVCTAEKLYANLDIVGKQFKFYTKIPNNAGRYLKAEGYIFPDTYDFYLGEAASSVLKKLYGNFQKKWTKEYSAKAKAIGMSVDEVITLASIIQREAKDATQMKEISSVLHNRLKDSATYPQLQMNSTKEYIDAVNEYGLFNEVYYSIYLDAYNTYSVTGLPAGPICNPGIDAIEAALEPADTNYKFFCHDSQGNIYLAETAEEHQRNTELVLFS